MLIKQISVFVENRPGSLAEVTQMLADHGIDIHAFCVADTTNFGILRMMVSNPHETFAVLREAQFTVSMTDIVAVRMQDRAGGLNDVLNALRDGEANVEYAYSFISRTSGFAAVLLCLDDNAKGARLLKERGFPVLTAEEMLAF